VRAVFAVVPKAGAQCTASPSSEGGSRIASPPGEILAGPNRDGAGIPSVEVDDAKDAVAAGKPSTIDRAASHQGGAP
jgi:hypothetical protein